MMISDPFLAKPFERILSPVHNLALSSIPRAIKGVSSSSISFVKANALTQDCSLIDSSKTKFIVDKTNASISDKF